MSEPPRAPEAPALTGAAVSRDSTRMGALGGAGGSVGSCTVSSPALPGAGTAAAESGAEATPSLFAEEAVPDPIVAGLEPRPSRIEGAGLGLFATRAFAPGETLCEYRGVKLRTVQAMRLSDKSYLMRLGPQCYVDSKPTKHVLARYINDARDRKLTNVVFEKQPEHERALVVAIRDIAPGDEVFVDYGKWYWAGTDVKPGSVRPAAMHSE